MIIQHLREIKPKLVFILETAEKVNTRLLENMIYSRTKFAFESLKPLRRKYTVTQIELDEGWRPTRLAIGTWFRAKTSWYTYGRNLYTDFIEFIIKYGDQILPHLRKSIMEDFDKLVKLTKQIKRPSDNEVIYKLPEVKKVFDYSLSRSFRLTPLEVSAIKLETNTPSRIEIYSNRSFSKSFHINYYSDIHFASQFIDELVELFKLADQQVKDIREHNNAIIQQMEDVVAPYRLSKALK